MRTTASAWLAPAVALIVLLGAAIPVDAARAEGVVQLAEHCEKKDRGVLVTGSGFEPFKSIQTRAIAYRPDGGLFGPIFDWTVKQTDGNGEFEVLLSGTGPLSWQVGVFGEPGIGQGGGVELFRGEVESDCPEFPVHPVLGSFYLSPSVFLRAGRPIDLERTARGARIHLYLSEAATVRFRVRREPVGTGGRPPRKPRSFKRELPAGISEIPFGGKIGDFAMRPGFYRLYAVARNAAKLSSGRTWATFQIVPRHRTPEAHSELK